MIESGEKMGLNDNQKHVIDELYREMHHSLSVYAQSALYDHSLAEEAVQDTFRIACAKADDLLRSSNPRGWLLKTLQNVIKNTVRHRANLNRIIVSSLDLDEDIIFGDTDASDIDFLYSDVADSEDYKLLKKIALEKYTMLEAAQELGISVEACKKRVQRAKKKLKKRFKEKN